MQAMLYVGVILLLFETYFFITQSNKLVVTKRELKSREEQNEKLKERNEELEKKIKSLKKIEWSNDIEQFYESEWYRLSLWEKFKKSRRSRKYYYYTHGMNELVFYNYYIPFVVPGINIGEVKIMKLKTEEDDKTAFYTALEKKIIEQKKIRKELEEKFE